jgi:hypothetical protein
MGAKLPLSIAGHHLPTNHRKRVPLI